MPETAKRERFFGFLSRFYMIILMAALVAVTVLSAWKSVYFDLYEQNELPLYRGDHPVILLLGAVIFLVALAFLLKRSQAKYLTIFSVVYAGVVGLWIVLSFRALPFADSTACSSIATAFLHGDYSAFFLSGGDDYLTVYPFQIGFIAFLELIYRVFGEGNTLALQIINVIAVMTIVRNLNELAKEVFRNEKVCEICAVLSLFIFPLYLNTTFVYGDVCGFACSIGALLCVFRFLSDGKGWHLVIAGAAMAIGILLKSNEMIFLIAIVIILFCDMIIKKKWKTLLYIGYVILMAMLLGKAVQWGYMQAAGLSEYPTGAPKISWITMGLIEDRYAEYGWYNGYNRNNYVENQYDYEMAQAKAQEDLKQALTGFSENKGHALYFMYRKFASAWNDPTFQSQITAEWGVRHVENLSPLVNSLVYGTGRTILYYLMNGIHFIVFLFSTIAVMVRLWRNEQEEWLRLSYLLLPVFGGMLFHMIWETQCRYLIVYYVILVPVAAAGIKDVLDKCKRSK